MYVCDTCVSVLQVCDLVGGDRGAGAARRSAARLDRQLPAAHVRRPVPLAGAGDRHGARQRRHRVAGRRPVRRPVDAARRRAGRRRPGGAHAPRPLHARHRLVRAPRRHHAARTQLRVPAAVGVQWVAVGVQRVAVGGRAALRRHPAVRPAAAPAADRLRRRADAVVRVRGHVRGTGGRRRGGQPGGRGEAGAGRPDADRGGRGGAARGGVRRLRRVLRRDGGADVRRARHGDDAAGGAADVRGDPGGPRGAAVLRPLHPRLRLTGRQERQACMLGLYASCMHASMHACMHT